MATIQVQVPKSLALSQDQMNQLREQFRSQVVEAFQAESREISVAAKAKAEVVHVEVIAL